MFSPFTPLPQPGPTVRVLFPLCMSAKTGLHEHADKLGTRCAHTQHLAEAHLSTKSPRNRYRCSGGGPNLANMRSSML